MCYSVLVVLHLCRQISILADIRGYLLSLAKHRVRVRVQGVGLGFRVQGQGLGLDNEVTHLV